VAEDDPQSVSDAESASREASSPEPALDRASNVAPERADAVLCPRCGYDLRAAVEPRCPECGLTFTWDELTDLREVPWLYETAPAGRRVRCWLGTFRRSLRPVRFWSAIPMTIRPMPLRLVAYWLVLAIAVLLLTCVLVKAVIVTSDVVFLVLSKRRYGYPGGGYWENIWYEISLWLTAPLSGLPEWPGLVIPALYPVATLLALLICLKSLLRMRIRLGHVLRIVVYSSAWTALWPICYTIGAAAVQVTDLILAFRYNTYLYDYQRLRMAFGVGAAVGAIMSLAFMIALARGFRHYARYERVWPIVLASQIIAVLVALNVVGIWLTRTFF
jgi:hypothetical protein